MRPLRWLHRELRALRVEVMTVKRERLLVSERRPHVVDEFQGRRLAQIVVETERAEIVRVDSGNEAQLHAPAQHLVDDRDLFSKAQRMVERHNVTHRPDAHAAGARAGTYCKEARRRHPALVGTEVMLDAK